jgi:hypothetical protein
MQHEERVFPWRYPVFTLCGVCYLLDRVMLGQHARPISKNHSACSKSLPPTPVSNRPDFGLAYMLNTYVSATTSIHMQGDERTCGTAGEVANRYCCGLRPQYR